MVSIARFLTAVASVLSAFCAHAESDIPSALTIPESYFSSGKTAQAASAFARADWQSARDEFARVLETVPDDLRPRVALMIAIADTKLGHWHDAAQGFERAMNALPLTGDYAAYQAGRAYYFAHELDKARELLKRVSADSRFAAEKLLLLGDILRGQGQWREVARHYEAYLGGHSLREAEARFRLAEAYEKLGRTADALREYGRLTFTASLTTWGTEAESALLRLSSSVSKKKRAHKLGLAADELITRGKILFEAMRNPESEADFSAALKARGLTLAMECDARYHLAQSVFKQRDRARAAPLFDAATAACSRAGNADLETRAAYQAGRGWVAHNEPEQAIARFERAEKSHPEHSFADDARLRQAEVWKDLEKKQVLGASEKVALLLSSIPDLYPHGDMRAEALWRLAWREYRAGRLETALTGLDRQIATVPLEENYWAEGQPQYWRGRILDRLGRVKDAISAYEQTVREYPLSYYALLALNRLRENAPARFKTISEELRRPKARETFAILPRPIYATTGFARAVEFLRLGLGEEGESELREIGLKIPGGRNKVTDPDEMELLWATAYLYDRAGQYDKSHWIARWSVLDYKRDWPTAANRRRWDIAYPKAWWHLLAPAATMQGYAPELLIAFVREESAFTPTLESFANAIGLTQMIFPTANRFGKELGFPITRENLRDPEKNVAIGSRFLAFLYRTFDSYVGLVVPAYNAGEGAVWRWLCERGDWPLDEFAEAIPYDETRNYSKRVLSSYFAYSYLGSETIPTIPNTIPRGVINRKKCR